MIDCLVLFVKKLNDEAENGALVVVEGQRDAAALQSIGFHGKLFLLCHRESLIKLLAEAEKYSKIILLLDLDSKGRSLTKKAARLLEEKKRAIDLFFRKKLSSATEGRVKHIEELIFFKEYIQPQEIMRQSRVGCPHVDCQTSRQNCQSGGQHS